MKGILEKKEGELFVRWSDLHSFARGTEWNHTPIHPNEYEESLELLIGEQVEFEFINEGYDEKSFLPNNYIKIVNK